MIRRRLIVGGVVSDVGPYDFFLDPMLWYVIGSVAISICGGTLSEALVTKAQAEAMADALEDADLESCIRHLAGMEKMPTDFSVAQEWLHGDEGRMRLSRFIGFL